MTKEEMLKDDFVASHYGDRARNWIDTAFMDGAEWMQERMIEKAVEWLDNNVDKYCFNSGGKFEYIPKVGRKMISDFKQAMQDESGRLDKSRG